MEHFDELDRMRNRKKSRGRKGFGNREKNAAFEYDDGGYDDSYDDDGYDDGYDDDVYDDGYDDGYDDDYDDDGYDDGYDDYDYNGANYPKDELKLEMINLRCKADTVHGDSRNTPRGQAGMRSPKAHSNDYIGNDFYEDEDPYYRNSRANQRFRSSGKDSSGKAVSEKIASRSGSASGSRYRDDYKTKNGSRNGQEENNRMGTKKNYRNAGQASNPEGRTGSAKSAKRKKKKKFLVVELVVLIALLSSLFFFMKKGSSGYWTIAVFGVDSRNGNLEKGALSDVEMLCVVDRKTGEMKLVSVYRDTYLQIDDKGTFYKINEAYFKGGHKQAVSALERNLDLKIDDYATFNWKAVADAINILGGIDLEITDSEFKYINSFITETVNSTGIGSHQLKRAGMNHLDGVQAVAYARLRLMDTDFNRTARQRKVLSLAMEKAKQANFSTLNNILVTVLPQISTSIGIDDLIPMAKNISKYHIGTTDGFPFSRGVTKIDKHSSVIPLTLESNVIQLHQLLYGVEDYQPSSTVKKISEKIAKDSGMGEVAENAPKVTAGGSSGGSGNSSAASASPSTQAQPTAPPETSKEVVTEPETTEAETTQETEVPTLESSSQEIGPGGGGPGMGEGAKPSKGPTKEETTNVPESTLSSEGPGGSGGPGESGGPGGNGNPGGNSGKNPNAVFPVPHSPGDNGGDSSLQQGPGM